MKKQLSSVFFGLVLFLTTLSSSAYAGCGYQTVWDPQSGNFITVWVCTPDPGPEDPAPKCGYQTVWDPQSGSFVTVWVCGD